MYSTKNNFNASDGLQALRNHWRNDVGSGFLVFLIALPLCLGIAMASGFPPIGGIVTAVVGGILVGPLMGARLTIKGPAAGLIAIVAASVMELGAGDPMAGYRYTLAVLVVAGALQMAFALMRLGRFVDFFPVAAVQGMMAAIGVIIVAKQLPVLLGVELEASSIPSLLLQLPTLLWRFNPGIALIGVLSLAILFALPLVKSRWVKLLPAPLLVILIAIPLGYFFNLGQAHQYLFFNEVYEAGPGFLVSLPDNLLDGITFPDFGKLLTWTSLKFILMFALVGSLESLLTVKAIDGIDPCHQKSDGNRDLLATGLGNTVVAFIGGLPMISEVVRSSANVNAGAKSRWSNVYHGIFLLVFVAFFPGLLRQIPLAALAALLVYTGIRLASPALFKNIYAIGREQLGVCIFTLVVTLSTDLLIGVMAGVVLEFLLHLKAGIKPAQLFRTGFRMVQKNDLIILRARSAAAFTNFPGFKSQLDALPKGAKVCIDFGQARLVDHSFLDQLHRFAVKHRKEGGELEIVGLGHLKATSAHALSRRKLVQEQT